MANVFGTKKTTLVWMVGRRRAERCIRELVVNRSQSWEIKDYAIKAQGMRTLRQDGLRKAEQGLTTLQEVIAVTTEE